MPSLAEKLDETFRYCLLNDNEIVDKQTPPDAIVVDCVLAKFGFHPGRVAERREQIREMLKEMDDQFQVGPGCGGGTSFLNLCVDRHGEQWTGFHTTVELLVGIGIAAGMVSFPMPRDMWNILPGGMPYVTINTTIP